MPYDLNMPAPDHAGQRSNDRPERTRFDVLDRWFRRARRDGSVRAFACVAIFVLLTGCQQVTPSVSGQQPTSFRPKVLQPSMLHRVRKIAIVSCENNTRYRSLGPSMIKSMSAAIRANGRDIVDISNQYHQACRVDTVLRGEYPIQVLADAWRHFHCDAVVFARINEFNPYSPLSIGMTIHMVDAKDAVLLATVSGHWSLGNDSVRKEYEEYLAKRFPTCKQPSIYLSSPQMFGEFVMSRIATKW